jgi:Protein of unknown function (DUF2637)
MSADKDRYRMLTTAAVLLVAAIAAVISFVHIESLAIRYGQPPLAAFLLPISIDGTVAVGPVAGPDHAVPRGRRNAGVQRRVRAAARHTGRPAVRVAGCCFHRLRRGRHLDVAEEGTGTAPHSGQGRAVQGDTRTAEVRDTQAPAARH